MTDGEIVERETPRTGPPVTPRLVGIDAFRGAVLAFMLITPVTGAAGSVPMLRHAEWNGWTWSDLVFPSFLVTSGTSLAFLLGPPVKPEVRLRLVRRVIALLVLGVLYNAYGATGADFAAVRLTGVLQLIGLSGGLAAVIVLAARRGVGRDSAVVLAAVALGLVALYGVGLTVFGSPRCEGRHQCSPYVDLDRAVLGQAHLYRGMEVDYDPEGLAVVVAATALVLAGYVAGSQLRGRTAIDRRLVARGVAGGVALVVAGLALGELQPINKRLHTPAFSLFAAGAAVVGLLCFTGVFQRGGHGAVGVVRRLRRLGAAPFLPLGRNALIVYFVERVVHQSALATHVGAGTLEDWFFAHVVPFTGVAADLSYGVLLYGFVWVVTSAMALMRWHVTL